MKTVVDKYLGGYAHMFSAGRSSMQFKFAPTILLVDLRTMKIVASGSGRELNSSKLVQECNKLPDE